MSEDVWAASGHEIANVGRRGSVRSGEKDTSDQISDHRSAPGRAPPSAWTSNALLSRSRLGAFDARSNALKAPSKSPAPRRATPSRMSASSRSAGAASGATMIALSARIAASYRPRSVSAFASAIWSSRFWFVAGPVASAAAGRAAAASAPATSRANRVRPVGEDVIAFPPSTEAAEGVDPARPARVVTEGAAQGHDVVVHVSQRGVGIESAHLFHDVGARHDLAAPPRQDLEDEDVVGRQVKRSVRAGGGHPAEVEAEPADHDLAGLRRTILGAAHQRAYPRQQLPKREGLGEIVVGSQFQTDDAVHDLALGGQHEHRYAVSGRAQLAQDVEPGAAGQEDVQDYELRAKVVNRPHGLVATGDQAHVVALVAEMVPEPARERGLVFDD